MACTEIYLEICQNSINIHKHMDLYIYLYMHTHSIHISTSTYTLATSWLCVINGVFSHIECLLFLLKKQTFIP